MKNNNKFCSCERTLHEGKCYKEGKELEEYIKHENLKKCPKYRFLIKKQLDVIIWYVTIQIAIMNSGYVWTCVYLIIILQDYVKGFNLSLKIVWLIKWWVFILDHTCLFCFKYYMVWVLRFNVYFVYAHCLSVGIQYQGKSSNVYVWIEKWMSIYNGE